MRKLNDNQIKKCDQKLFRYHEISKKIFHLKNKIVNLR